MKLLQIMIMFFFVSTLNGQTKKIEVEKIYFNSPSNQVATEISFYKKGKKHIYHGNYKEYSKNGHLISVKSFKDGKLNGKFIVYYESGNILIEESYLDGSRIGSTLKYYENGSLMTETVELEKELKIIKYGFPNGKYALKHKTQSGVDFYKVFDKSNNFLYSTDTSLFNKNDSTNKIDCKFKALRYPDNAINCQQEGIVIVKLRIDSLGIADAEPLDYFNEEAIKEVIESIEKSDCYKKKTEFNNEEKQYFIYAFVFKII